MKLAGPEYAQLEYRQEYYTRNSGNGALPTAESEHVRKQRTTGQRTDARAGSSQCTNCGKVFEPSKYTVHKQKYCSYRCKRSALASRKIPVT
jgi:hypothetical protein